ncbi:MAG: helix-turn-helix domain-containing protein [Saccharopolyspora sp.]|uniref:helix-turn-helix transcriptional regulator n=1 Tax=Saccharopolyspora TaxID=1835 RepID=UPI00190CEC02|nr:MULTISPECIES: helix-turn-helix transcriptional regulator [unclassified Saccharopolyspora]MBK0865452.1 helix-turn-helix domain-containing protein [Saccharopolyspora sp. HNM0986]MBQ6644761.1 helix-turn-helix domain-containing protein [Saccharopolyspora sp.]
MSPQRTALSGFLRSCRARVDPAELGLPDTGRRRVPGLRREELARLAGVSVDYCTRLEQGRSTTASAEVLDALAGALRLNDAERSHLFDLARPGPERKRRPKPQRVAPATLDLVRSLDQVCSPAFVLGRRLDVLAHNRIAAALITDFNALPAQRRNQARFVFFDPHAPELYADWDAVAADTVAMLRLDAGRNPDDPKLSALIGELSIHSEKFRRCWSDNKVHLRTTGTKGYHHPLVGDLTVRYQALTPNGDPDQSVYVYTTEPGSSSEAAMHLLSRLTSEGSERTAEQPTPG